MFALALTTMLVATPQAASGPPYPRIANCYGAGISANMDAARIAEVARLGLVIGSVTFNSSDPQNCRQVSDKIQAIRKINPSIIILDFHISAPYLDPKHAEGFPADGWLLQADHAQLDGWPETKMVNLTKVDVREWLANRSLDFRKVSGIDGVFIDSMSPSFDGWACNIATHKPWTVDLDGKGVPTDQGRLDREWADAKLQLVKLIRSKLGRNDLIMCNQAGQETAPYINGVLLEDYLDYVLDNNPKYSWTSVDLAYRKWIDASLTPALTAIVSSSGVVPPFSAENLPAEQTKPLLDQGKAQLQRMRFGLTSALLADGYYAFDLNTRWRGQHWWYPEYDAKLGYPTGPVKHGPRRTYVREFDAGVVYVNPTTSPIRIKLRKQMKNVSTGETSRDVEIAGQDGAIFVPAP